MVNNKNLFDYRCWINNAGEDVSNAKKNPQYGLLITAICQ